jgi:hypothetical protein
MLLTGLDTGVIEKMTARLQDLEKFAEENRQFLDTHRHLDEDTPERAYWHAGYASALRDLLNILSGARSSN